MSSLLHKSRKPRFELHLKIYDLNNVPLRAGVSLIKWHLPHSIHGEHRDRTNKCPIANHRVEYNYSKIVLVRIAIDKSNNLQECPVEFEVLQEFESGGSGRDEKIVLGKVTLNLSEYVEESESITRDTRRPGTADSRSGGQGHARKRSSLSGISPSRIPGKVAEEQVEEVEEGVVRRYLMQDSKINSTLKIGILMVQVDGERSYVAPPLKTAPVFGGIAGIVTGASEREQVVDPSQDADGAGQAGGQLPTLSKSRDTSEVQDMYRRALAASWTCQQDELPADECIEDIFSGGDGFRNRSESTGGGGGGNDGSSATNSPVKTSSREHHHHHHRREHSAQHHRHRPTYGSPPRTPDSYSPASNDDDDYDDDSMLGGTLRPQDARRFTQLSTQQQQQHPRPPQRPPSAQSRHHARHTSTTSDRSAHTVTRETSHRNRNRDRRDRDRDRDPRPRSRGGDDASPAKDDSGSGGAPSRTGSLTSLAPSSGGGRRDGGGGVRRVKEVHEAEVRDDLVAWALPDAVVR